MKTNLLIFLFYLLITRTYSETISIPVDYTTIQAAIDAAQVGDTVLVEPGVYHENLRIVNKCIVLAGLYLSTNDTNLVAQTIINGGDSVQVCWIDSCQNLKIIGLSITNGGAGLGGWGGGIRARNSNMELSYIKVHNNRSIREAAGINLYNSNVNINRISVEHNVCTHSLGSGIYCDESEVNIKNSNILFNKRNGIIIYYSTVILDSCNIIQNLSEDNVGTGISGYASVVEINHLNVLGYRGRGISLNDSDTEIRNSKVYGNAGGGLALAGETIIRNIKVYDNNGPGIRSTGFIIIDNSSIFNNHSTWAGGGVEIYSTQENVYIKNTQIYSNSAFQYGGGIYFSGDLPLYLENVTISDNYAPLGGGIYFNGFRTPKFELKNVTVSENKAQKGGGIFIVLGINKIIFDSQVNIYSNYAGQGNELYYDLNDKDAVPFLNATIDTFTVEEITDDYIFPSENFNIEIRNFKLQKNYAENAYVSMDGNDSNNGLTPDKPLKTIHKALNLFKADSSHPCTINIATGEYKYLHDDVFFPLNMMDYINLKGSKESEVIFNGDSLTNILAFNRDNNINIQNITIKNGNYKDGGAIYALASSFSLDCVQIINNNATNGGGIFLKKSYLTAKELELIDNNSSTFGGAMYMDSSDVNIYFSSFTQNQSNNGGVCTLENASRLTFRNTLIADNTADSRGGALYCNSNSFSTLINTTFANNVAGSRGGSYCGWASKSVIVNSILWLNKPTEIYLSTVYDSVYIYHSNIMAGLDSLDANNRGYIYWAENNSISNPMLNENNYTLLSSSPCINAGTDFFVFEGDTLLNLVPEEYYGSAPDMGAYEFGDPATIEQETIKLPNRYTLHQNYPNPFNPTTIINYELPTTITVDLGIYNLLGQKVAVLVSERQSAGSYEVQWDASGFASGVYYYRIEAGEFQDVKKMVLLR